MSPNLYDLLQLISDERLKKYLNLENGYVSPFGVINNEDRSVIFVFDKSITLISLDKNAWGCIVVIVLGKLIFLILL